jgi:hypothetical protein
VQGTCRMVIGACNGGPFTRGVGAKMVQDFGGGNYHFGFVCILTSERCVWCVSGPPEKTVVSVASAKGGEESACLQEFPLSVVVRERMWLFINIWQ